MEISTKSGGDNGTDSERQDFVTKEELRKELNEAGKGFSHYAGKSLYSIAKTVGLVAGWGTLVVTAAGACGLCWNELRVWTL